MREVRKQREVSEPFSTLAIISEGLYSDRQTLTERL